MSDSARTCSRYASSASRCSGAHSSTASGASAATTKNVAPNSVSGRVVNTVTVRLSPAVPAPPWPTTKSTCAPCERPIQFSCIFSTRVGHVPRSCSMSSSSRSAYSVTRKNHCVSSRLVTTVPQRSQAPCTTCSLASTVWSLGHQLTAEDLR